MEQALKAQRLLSFDIETREVDTLEAPAFDSLQLRDQTPHVVGNFSDLYNNLSSTAPTSNTYPGSQYTFKRQASLDYDLEKFPLRTSVRLSRIDEGINHSHCSGSMISPRHVLTATHCIAQFASDSVNYDSLLVCPILDNGMESSTFDCSWVKKAYFFEQWDIATTDIAVLELEDPIGEETGWLGIGFEAMDSTLLDGLFYKFSYPALPLLTVDSTNYNGDTLYYGFGIADLAGGHGIAITNTNGRAGESGSSIIKVRNEQQYTSYGVLSFSNNLYHSRLTNWKYYAFEAVIHDDIQVGNPKVLEPGITVYPNPVDDVLHVSMPKSKAGNLRLLDSNGQTLIAPMALSEREARLNLGKLPAGVYVLIITMEEQSVIRRIVKI